jgi:hypothetical protein
LFGHILCPLVKRPVETIGETIGETIDETIGGVRFVRRWASASRGEHPSGTSSSSVRRGANANSDRSRISRVFPAEQNCRTGYRVRRLAWHTPTGSPYPFVKEAQPSLEA